MQKSVAYFLSLHDYNCVISCIFVCLFIYLLCCDKITGVTASVTCYFFFSFFCFMVSLLSEYPQILFYFIIFYSPFCVTLSLFLLCCLLLFLCLPVKQSESTFIPLPALSYTDPSERIWLGLPVCSPGHCHLLIAFSWREVGGREREREHRIEKERGRARRGRVKGELWSRQRITWAEICLQTEQERSHRHHYVEAGLLEKTTGNTQESHHFVWKMHFILCVFAAEKPDQMVWGRHSFECAALTSSRSDGCMPLLFLFLCYGENGWL